MVPLWALISFFSYFLFLPFFVFFLAFYFSFFSIFCSVLHFLFFKCFSFSFFNFSEEKVSSFLFSCISFKYFLLLALKSKFNCFLRSRCSMEMWCPDDIGRDSWDWVGPPAWRRACFNSPEWGGGSSPVTYESARMSTSPHACKRMLIKKASKPGDVGLQHCPRRVTPPQPCHVQVLYPQKPDHNAS